MKHFLILIITTAALLPTVPLQAQHTDTAASIVSTQPAADTTVAKVHHPYKTFLLPAALMVYGVASLQVHALEDLNARVKQAVYTQPMPHPVKIDDYLPYAPAAAVYILNAAGIPGKNNFRDRTILYGLSNLVMEAMVYPMKHITHETRPDGSDDLSFPSGHTASAFVAAEFLRQEYGQSSPFYSIAGYAVATLTGYFRIANNKHWLGDVIGGAGAGILATRIAYWVYPAIKRKWFKEKPMHAMVMPSFQPHAPGLAMAYFF